MQDGILDRMLNALNSSNLNYSNLTELKDDDKLKETLQFDSLDILEYSMCLEDEFNIGDIDDNVKFITIKDIREYIEGNL